MSAQAGWYADSNNPGHDRYWDGTAWTDQIRQSAVAPPPWSVPASPASAVTPKKSGSSKVGWAVVLVVVLLLIVGGIGAAMSGSNETTSGTSIKAAAPVTKPSASASSAEPSASPSPSKKTVTCFDWQVRVEAAFRKKGPAGAKAVAAKAKTAGCHPRIPGVGGSSGGGGSSDVNFTDGIAWKWADNPSCGFSSLGCFGMTVRADFQSCPNGLYVEINLLDGKDNVIGYSNDTVGSLAQGQKAKLTFPIIEDGVKTAQMTKISCY